MDRANGDTSESASARRVLRAKALAFCASSFAFCPFGILDCAMASARLDA